MAVRGNLDIELNDVKCYENFSVLYLSSIINSFRRWAAHEYRQIEQFIPPSESDVKMIEAPKEESAWGYLIENAYQHFLSFGQEQYRFWPVSFYDQLVKDEVIRDDLFRDAMPIVRKILTGDLIREKTKLLAQAGVIADDISNNKNKNIEERLEFVKSINNTNIIEAEQKIMQYSSGEKDGELVVMAKQYCVLQYFKKSKKEGMRNIYQPVKSNSNE